MCEVDDGITEIQSFVRWLAAPPWVAVFLLFGLFGAFVMFLALDASSRYEVARKPIVLPISFLLFLPVWVLYAATLPLAALLTITGIGPSPDLALVVRAIVLAVGFPTLRRATDVRRLGFDFRIPGA